MRYFGLYFAFFCFAFSYVFKGDIKAAALFGSDMLFSYFVFTTAISLSLMLVLFLAIKKGLSLANISPFFGGLFKGAAGLFFVTLLANRATLLLGAYLLSLSAQTADAYMTAISAVFLLFGYSVFRPFNFDFVGGIGAAGRQNAKMNEYNKSDSGTTIDAEVIEVQEVLEKK